MSRLKDRMRQGLAEIQHLRDLEKSDEALARRLHALRSWQGERLVATYVDIAAKPRFSAAIRFFQDDLYGGNDFSDRDRDFERVFPVMVRMLPGKVLGTVADVIALHQLSEHLDHAMCERIQLPITGPQYITTWCQVGERSMREQQVEMIGKVAYSLDRIVGKGVIRGLLRVMHGPAHAAGLGAMQGFLERGFDAFHAMGGAREFVGVLQSRESMILQNLYAQQSEPFAPWITMAELCARAHPSQAAAVA